MVRSYLFLLVILGSITALGWWSDRVEGQTGVTRTPAQYSLGLGEQKAQLSPQAQPSPHSSLPLEIEPLTVETRVQ